MNKSYILCLLMFAGCAGVEQHSNTAGHGAAGAEQPQAGVGSGGKTSPVAGSGGKSAGGAGGSTGGTGGSPDVSVAGNGSDPARTDGCPADAPQNVNRVVISGSNLSGVLIQGSNAGPTTNFEDLATVGNRTDFYFENGMMYRYLRAYSQASSTVYELHFYHDKRELGGTPFGTASGGNAAFAFDNDASSSFALNDAGGGYVGRDVATGYLASAPTFGGGATIQAQAFDVTLLGTNVHYTLDGSTPTKDSPLYTAPIHVTDQVNISAISVVDCMFTSSVVTATYKVGTPPMITGQRTYHIGNSLTDTINAYLKPIADSTGVTHSFARWTIPGSSIEWSYTHQDSGFITDGFGEVCNTTECVARNVFDKFVVNNAPLDHISVQPYNDYTVSTQGISAAAMLNAAVANSPNVQGWVYQQWPGQTTWPLANGYTVTGETWKPSITPTTWEESVQVSKEYFEYFAKQVDPMVNGKALKIIPAAQGMLALKKAIDAGQVDGLTSANFFTDFFADDEHLTVKGQYFVSLIFYSCFYERSPEGAGAYQTADLTAAQAAAFQKIAWTAVQNAK